MVCALCQPRQRFARLCGLFRRCDFSAFVAALPQKGILADLAVSDSLAGLPGTGGYHKEAAFF